MALETIQQAFAQAIYGNESTGLKARILSHPNFTATERIDIYRYNTLATLIAALQSTYPICRQLLGERYFQQVATHYVNQHPSKQRDLNQYGEALPKMLAELITVRSELRQFGYLTDVAQLEWYLNKAYYARHRPAFDLEAFATLSSAQQLIVRLELAEDIALMQSHYPLFAIWQSHQKDDHHRYSATDWQKQWQQENSQCLLILRENFQPKVMLIEATLYHLLIALQAKQPLLALNRYLGESPIELSELIQRQWITGFLE